MAGLPFKLSIGPVGGRFGFVGGGLLLVWKLGFGCRF